MTQRHDVLLAAWESCKDRLPVTFDAFEEATRGWDATPVYASGCLVGAILQNGVEIHACIKPEGFGKWLSRRVLRETIGATVKMHGRAITKVQQGNKVGDAFVRRLGFTPVSTSGGIVTYEVTHGY